MTAVLRPLTLLLCASLLAACIDPKDRRPGLRLSGEIHAGPVEDWSFTDEHAEIYIETRTPYGLPHSVTIVCTAVDGRLYVGARNPTEKRWVGYVARDANVRLKIGDRVYEQRLERVEDEAERERVHGGYAAKYGWDHRPRDQRPELRVYRVLPRS